MTLPILLSIPHGGTQIPPEIAAQVNITPHNLLDDSDAYTREIYDLGELVQTVVAADVARAFVDLNRAPTDRPPDNPDGVVKSMTCLRQPIYETLLTADQTAALLKKYYEPYHQQVQAAVQEVALAFDCHSMLPTGPAIGPDTGSTRPLICLGNRHGETSSMATLERLAICFREVFELAEEDVALNVPFAGGYITRTYGRQPIPWIQIELNRSLYLAPPWFDRETITMDAGRLTVLRHLLAETLTRFWKSVAPNVPAL